MTLAPQGSGPARLPSGELDVSLQRDAPFPIDVELDCQPGELLALAGPSGSGKTTVLRMIAGLERADRGHVRVGERRWYDSTTPLSLAPEKRRVGLVFQHYALFPHLDARGNLEIAMQGRSRSERRQRANELLALVNLDGLAQRRPAALSGGQRQRVALARALARDPDVLLLDEPFSAVDQLTRRRLHRELARIRQELEIPMLLVTHDIDEVMLLADSLAVVHRGRVLQRGPVDALMTRPASVDVARLLGHQNLVRAVSTGVDGADVGFALDGRRPVAHACARLCCPAASVPATARSPGTPVVLLVPASAIVLHRRDRPSRGERENPLEALVVEAISLGDEWSLRVEVPGGPRLGFRLSRHVATRNAVEEGSMIRLSIVADALHVMPAERPHS